MTFDESVDYLLSLGNEVLAMKLGLENIGKLLDALGNPQKNYLKVQIAGTNGKGSTCAFLDSICRDANITTGLYTSPHLISITERVKIDGSDITEPDFAKIATRVRQVSEELVAVGHLEAVPTYFEQITAIALTAFSENNIELGILETGLGGRFDATTAARAEIVAITPIDYDHQQILGNTLTEIAGEKAAIIRSGTEVVVAAQIDEAKQVILEKCRAEDVEPVWAPLASEIKVTDDAVLAGTFVTENETYCDFKIGLRGRHQFVNAATAISLAEVLRKHDFNITGENIRNGLENARHPGRLEYFKGVLFDGAHNVAGARALRNFLDEFVDRPITMIFGAMRDKDLREIAGTLFPKADRLILTKPDNIRSMDANEIFEFLPADYDRSLVSLTQTVEEAVTKARQVSAPGDLICITGSLYLVGEAQGLLSRN